jgi:hypothetical protein
VCDAPHRAWSAMRAVGPGATRLSLRSGVAGTACAAVVPAAVGRSGRANPDRVAAAGTASGPAPFPGREVVGEAGSGTIGSLTALVLLFLEVAAADDSGTAAEGTASPVDASDRRRPASSATARGSAAAAAAVPSSSSSSLPPAAAVVVDADGRWYMMVVPGDTRYGRTGDGGSLSPCAGDASDDAALLPSSPPPRPDLTGFATRVGSALAVAAAVGVKEASSWRRSPAAEAVLWPGVRRYKATQKRTFVKCTDKHRKWR